MLEFDGVEYYIDLDALDKLITIKSGLKGDVYTEKEIKKGTFTSSDGSSTGSTMVEEFERQSPQSKEIDATKYDLIKYFLEVIIDFDGIEDDTLGADRELDKAPLGYKIVFNTLLKQGIIKEA